MKRLIVSSIFLILSAVVHAQTKRITETDSLKIGGRLIGQFGTDVNLGLSDKILPTQKAVKIYVDSKVFSGTTNPNLFVTTTQFLDSMTSIRSSILAGASTWGNITGLLSNQLDLAARFRQKPDSTTIGSGPTTDTVKEWYAGIYFVRGIFDVKQGLISGGVVTYSGQGLIYNISPTVYRLNRKRISLPAGQVTLPAADMQFNMRDGIGVDTTGSYIVIPGVPAINPVDPQPNPLSQWLLTYASVNANDTVPSNISANVIWDNDVFPDWTVSSTGITFDSKNTTSPYHSPVAIRTNGWINGSRITLLNNQAISLANADVLNFWVKNTVAVPSTANIIITFLNNTTAISNTIAIPGYDRNNTTTYQNISVALSSLQFTGGSFNSIAIGFNGNVSSGVYLDYFQLQNGVNGTNSSGVITFNSRNGNVIPMPGDYKVADITGLIDVLNQKQPLLPAGDTTQYWRADGTLGKMLVPQRDSVSFTNRFRNLGNKGYPIIDENPNGVPVGTFPNATVTTDSMGHITNIIAGTNSGGVAVETDPVFLASVAHSITSTDITNWNNKLSSYTETDPVFLASVAHSITSTNISNWNAAFSTLSSLATVATSGSYNDLLNKPVIPAQFNLIAGTNISLSGTYPNITVNSTATAGTTQVTSYQTATATGGQTSFTFTGVPASNSDYMIFVNGGRWEYTTGYTTSGNSITTTSPLDAGDKISLVRIK